MVVPALDSASAACDAEAHRLYFECHDGLAALARWRLRAVLGPPTIESQLALAHCEIEAGIDAELPEIGVRQPAAPSDGRLRDYAEFILSCAWTHFRAGDAIRASKLARLVAAVDPHFKSIYEEQIVAAPNAAARGIPEPVPRSEPLPFERGVRLSDDAARGLLARHRGRRLLLFTSQYDGAADEAFENQPCRALRVTLTRLGFDVTVVESQKLTADEHVRLPDTLRGAIAAFRPDIIVCSDLLVSGATAYRQLQDPILSVLEEARRRFASKLVLTYTDGWYDGVPALFEALAGRADLFHVTFSGLLDRVPPAVAARTFCYPYPLYDPRPSGAAEHAQQLRAGFVGGISWANLSRLVWFAEIQRAGLPVDLYVRGREGSDVAAKSAVEYATLCGNYAVSLNLVARVNGSRIATGRSVEMPYFGSLLLEESSDDTAYFMTPYEHYVPFDSLAELSERLGILLADAPLRDRITRAGGAWVRRHFGGLHFWARLLRQLYEVEAPPPQPSGDYRSITVNFPHSAQSYFALARALAPAALH
jgi:hypothetical protein